MVVWISINYAGNIYATICLSLCFNILLAWSDFVSLVRVASKNICRNYIPMIMLSWFSFKGKMIYIWWYKRRTMRRMFAYTLLTAFMIDHFIKCANISFISVSAQAWCVMILIADHSDQACCNSCSFLSPLNFLMTKFNFPFSFPKCCYCPWFREKERFNQIINFWS